MSNPNYPQQPGYPQQPYPQQPQPPYGQQQQFPQQPYQQQPYQQPQPHGAPATTPSQPLAQNLKTAAIILGVSALAILIGIATKSWFTAGDEGKIGVSGLEACRGDRCMSISWGDFPKAPGEIKAFAYISLYGGIVSIICLAVAAVMIAIGNVRKVPWKVFNAILGFTVFGVVSFLVRGLFGEMSKGTTIGYSGFLALIGIIAGSTVLMKLVKPETEKPA